MKEKRNWKQEIKDWWKENHRVVKTGFTCLTIGTLVGYIMGVGKPIETYAGLPCDVPTDDDESDFNDVEDTNNDDRELFDFMDSSSEEEEEEEGPY